MAAAADEGRAFVTLQDLLSREEFEKAFKAASQLPVSKEQTETLVFSALQTGRWQEARAAIRRLRLQQHQGQQHQGQQQEGQQQQKQQQQKQQQPAAAAAPALALQEAYCFYRLNKPQKALLLLSDLQQKQQQQQDDSAATQLYAQVLHRCGRYREAWEIYGRLLRDQRQRDKEATELLVTNYIASTACMLQAEAASSSSCSSREICHPAAVTAALQQHCSSSEIYELPFNAACLAMQQRDPDTAEILLQRALELCAAEAHVSAAEALGCLDAGEIAGVLVQQAVLQQQQGNAAAAEAVYTAVLTAIEQQQQQQQQQQEIDVGVAAVAVTNAFVLSLQGRERQTADLEDLIKRAIRGAGEALEYKLTMPQALGIGVSRCLGLLRAGRLEECRRLVASLSSRYGSFLSLERIRAAIQFSTGRLHKSEETLRGLFKGSLCAEAVCPTERLELEICLASLLLQQGDKNGFSELLRGVQQQLLLLSQQQGGSKRYLALLAAAFELQQQAGDVEGALESLQLQRKALEAAKSASSVAAYVELSLTAAGIGASLGRWEFAAKLSEEALQRQQQQQKQQGAGGGDAAAAATELRATLSLTEALTRTDLSKAEVYVHRLMRYLPQSVNLIDSDEVEMRGFPVVLRGKRVGAAEATEGAASELKKKRRNKKPRYPKGWDPSKPQLPPDPERWLPKHERSGYKKMLRRRKECGRGGAQGTISAGTAEATTGFRDMGPTTAKTKAATDDSTSRAATRRKGGRR